MWEGEEEEGAHQNVEPFVARYVFWAPRITACIGLRATTIAGSKVMYIYFFCGYSGVSKTHKFSFKTERQDKFTASLETVSWNFSRNGGTVVVLLTELLSTTMCCEIIHLHSPTKNGNSSFRAEEYYKQPSGTDPGALVLILLFK